MADSLPSQPPAPAAPAAPEGTLGKGTRITLELAAVALGGALWLGGLSWSSKAIAEDVDAVKVEVRQKADKEAAGKLALEAADRERRIQTLERLAAVQAEQNRQNAEDHRALKEDVKQILTAVQRK